MAKAIQLVKVDKDYRGLLRAFSKMDDIAKNDMKKLSSQYDSIINQFKDFEVKAKELGVDTVMNQAKESVIFYQEKIRRADKYLTTIQALTKR